MSVMSVGKLSGGAHILLAIREATLGSALIIATSVGRALTATATSSAIRRSTWWLSWSNTSYVQVFRITHQVTWGR